MRNTNLNLTQPKQYDKFIPYIIWQDNYISDEKLKISDSRLTKGLLVEWRNVSKLFHLIDKNKNFIFRNMMLEKEISSRFSNWMYLSYTWFSWQIYIPLHPEVLFLENIRKSSQTDPVQIEIACDATPQLKRNCWI